MTDHDPIETKVRAKASASRRMRDLDLSGAELLGSDLSGARADRVDLSAARMRGAKWICGRLSRCVLAATDCREMDWSRSILRACRLDRVRGAGACFDDTRIEDCSVNRASLTHCSLRGARLTDSTFDRSSLYGAVLDGAGGIGIGFRRADLRGASLRGVHFDEPDFRGADLRHADLAGGAFLAGDFRGALLDGTRFEGADCSGALFDSDCGPNADRSGSRARSGGCTDVEALDIVGQVLAALRDQVASPRDGVTDQVRLALQRLGRPKAMSNDELRQWGESVLDVLRRDQSPDPIAALEVLSRGPIDLKGLLVGEGLAGEDVLRQLRSSGWPVAEGADRPPDWLEHLLLGLVDGPDLDQRKTAEEILRRLLGRRGGA